MNDIDASGGGEIPTGSPDARASAASRTLLEGQIVWVTGGSSGIGRAVAVDLAQAGARVVISGRRTVALEEVANEIKAVGGLVRVKSVDVRDRNEVEAAVAEILTEFGRIDVVVNAAGNNVPQRSWVDLSPKDWLDVTATNMS